MSKIELRGQKNWDCEEMLLAARQREQSTRDSVMPLLRHLHETWRGMLEHDDRPSPDALPFQRLRFDLAKAVFSDLSRPPVFDHAVDAHALREAYYAIEARTLAESNGTDQAGLGSLLTRLRHAAIDSEAGPDGKMPREIAFKANGIGYREIELIATFPEAGARAHLGQVEIAFEGRPRRPLASLPVSEVTGYKMGQRPIEPLARLHRHGRYGEGMSTFGNWFNADGEGRELLAAMIDGLVNRVQPDVDNGMGGVSPQFSLTEAGVEFVISHPRTAAIFDHFNEIEKTTAYLVDGEKRVPFDTCTGAILGRLLESRLTPVYVTKTNLAGVVAGQDHDRQNLGYLLLGDIERQRAQMIHLEDYVPAHPFLKLSEEEFDRDFVPVNASKSGTTSYEYDEVKDKDVRHVWTLVESDEDETAYALPGFHVVNAIGYAVTEKPWPHDNIEAVYMGPLEDSDELDETEECDEDSPRHLRM